VAVHRHSEGSGHDRFTLAVQGVLDPGERLQAGAKSAGNNGFLWVTDRRVILIGSTWFKARPKGVAWVELLRVPAFSSNRSASGSPMTTFPDPTKIGGGARCGTTEATGSGSG
jgi:hypothetical protein